MSPGSSKCCYFFFLTNLHYHMVQWQLYPMWLFQCDYSTINLSSLPSISSALNLIPIAIHKKTLSLTANKQKNNKVVGRLALANQNRKCLSQNHHIAVQCPMAYLSIYDIFINHLVWKIQKALKIIFEMLSEQFTLCTYIPTRLWAPSFKKELSVFSLLQRQV